MDMPLEELATRLSISTAEVDGIERRGVHDEDGNLGLFRVGKVVEAEKHPNADRLQLCRVELGFFLVRLSSQRNADVVVGYRRFRVDREYALKFLDGVFGLALTKQRDAQLHMRLLAVPVRAYCFRKHVLCLFIVVASKRMLALQ